MAQDLRHEFGQNGKRATGSQMPALLGRCPRCGDGLLFDGFLKLRTHCEACGLDYGFAEPHEGPAVLFICLACVPSVAFAVGFETFFEPPIWQHMLTSLPLLLLTTFLPLRPLKARLVLRRYRERCGGAKAGKTACENRQRA